jgi:hypothetical protein
VGTDTGGTEIAEALQGAAQKLAASLGSTLPDAFRGFYGEIQDGINGSVDRTEAADERFAREFSSLNDGYGAVPAAAPAGSGGGSSDRDPGAVAPDDPEGNGERSSWPA